MTATKENLICRLARIDTANFRKITKLKTGKIKKEPIKFQCKLIEIYNKLDKEDIITLINLKTL